VHAPGKPILRDVTVAPRIKWKKLQANSQIVSERRQCIEHHIAGVVNSFKPQHAKHAVLPETEASGKRNTQNETTKQKT